MVITAAACACLTFVAFLLAVYSTMRTPDVDYILIYQHGSLVAKQNKLLWLFGPLGGMVVVLGLSIFHLVTWQSFEGYLREGAKAQQYPMGPAEFLRGYYIYCGAMIGVELMMIGVVGQSAYKLLIS
jgi:hypothetical protein